MKMKEGNALQGSFPLDSGEGKGTKTGTIYFDEYGKGTISLKDGESAYITGLPEGTTYNVKETAYVDWPPSLLDDTTWDGTIRQDKSCRQNWSIQKVTRLKRCNLRMMCTNSHWHMKRL